MTRFFNKFGRLAAVVVLAGVAVPQVAFAGDKAGFSNRNFSKSMQSGGSNQFRMQKSVQPMAVKQFNSNAGNFKKLSGNSLQSSPKWTAQKLNTGNIGQNLSNKKIKTLPGTVLNSGKFTPTPIKTGRTEHVFQPGGKLSNVFPGKITTKPGKFPGKGPIVGTIDPVLNPFPGGKPPKVDSPFNPFPGGKPPVLDPTPGGKPPKADPPFNPFPGGKPPVLDPFPGGKPPKVDPFDPFPGGKPPVLDPTPGDKPPMADPPADPGQGGGNGNCPPGNDHCNTKCPWPVFWPIYQGGYWNNSCYYGSGYNTPVIVNSAPPVVVNEVVQASATVDYGTARVDLVLEDVQYVEPATMLVGPAYRVKFRNQGLTAVGKFRVALVAAIDGQASEQSPKALVEVAGLASGESSEVTVRLPVSAMKLAGADGKATIFTHLLVAADFDNSVDESDKTNNVAIIERSMLEVAAK